MERSIACAASPGRKSDESGAPSAGTTPFEHLDEPKCGEPALKSMDGLVVQAHAQPGRDGEGLGRRRRAEAALPCAEEDERELPSVVASVTGGGVNAGDVPFVVADDAVYPLAPRHEEAESSVRLERLRESRAACRKEWLKKFTRRV